MPIEYRKWITRAMLRAEPEKLFVFGDNMMRVGMGGQAAAMRGERNAVGIPTKWTPSMNETAFFKDTDFDAWNDGCRKDWMRLLQHSQKGGVIVWPTDDIGTGLARLNEMAPRIFHNIQVRKKNLMD